MAFCEAAGPFSYYKKSQFKNVQETNEMKLQEICLLNKENGKINAVILTGIKIKKIVQKWS
jgi:hypothetical protein